MLSFILISSFLAAVIVSGIVTVKKFVTPLHISLKNDPMRAPIPLNHPKALLITSGIVTVKKSVTFCHKDLKKSIACLPTLSVSVHPNHLANTLYIVVIALSIVLPINVVSPLIVA